MIGVIKLAAVFIAIILALRKNLFVGYILFAAGLVTAFLFGAGIEDILIGYKDVALSQNFLKIQAVIILITFLGRVLKDIGYLDHLVTASRGLVGGARTAAGVLPLLVGMMPMPGGALLSAPLVGKILPRDKYSPEFAAAVNYWSRHVIEFWWPVYPGIILAAALTQIPIGTMALMQLPMTFVMVPVGYILLIRKIKETGEGRGHLWKPLISTLSGVWPILLAITIYAVTEIHLVFAIMISIAVLLIKERPGAKIIKEAAKQALAPRLFALVFGILSFQQMLEITNAVNSIPELSSQYGLPPAAIIIAVAFISGLLTGMLAALVGLSYPILAGFLYQPTLNYNYIFLAFVSGYVGMMLSPTHFCLILTNEHFKAKLSKVYKYLAFPLLIVFLVGFLLYILAYPWGLFG